MSGLFGVTRSLDDAHVEQLRKMLEHRGPDSWRAERLSSGGHPVTFVHTRLAIQDRTPFGDQPMMSRDGQWCVNFNGELYNHFSLRSRIEGEFRGSSDTETLVEFIAAFGIEETLPLLNGIFAFAALNLKTGELVLARDPFGIKPLYYSCNSGVFHFSSEIKPLVAMGCGRGMNRDALETFLSLRYSPSPQTLLAGICRVPPGHFMRVSVASGEFETRRYIQPTTRRYQRSETDAADQYKRLLRETVRRQLASDKSVGVLLSGGIDSAILAALAAEFNRGVWGFTVGFGDDYPDCEISDAAETADALGIRHEHVIVTPEDLRDSLSEIFSCVEEPLGTTSIMPMWFLAKLAKKKATVVLTGHGTDEPWGGYRRYQIELLLEKYPSLKNPAFRLPNWITRLPMNDGTRRGLSCLGNADTASRFEAAYSLFAPAEVASLTGSANQGGARAAIGYWLNWLDDVEGLSDPERMMRIDSRMDLADDLMLYSDKLTMSAALEARMPMLDKELVEFIESLPVEFRTNLKENKIVHRRMAQDFLPPHIVNRPKKGFLVPFDKWSRSIWRDFVADRLVAGGLKLHDHVDRTVVERIWKQHQRKLPDRSRQIFSLLMLSGWCEEFM